MIERRDYESVDERAYNKISPTTVWLENNNMFRKTTKEKSQAVMC